MTARDDVLNMSAMAVTGQTMFLAVGRVGQATADRKPMPSAKSKLWTAPRNWCKARFVLKSEAKIESGRNDSGNTVIGSWSIYCELWIKP